MDRRFLGILAIIIIILGGVFAVTKNSGDTKTGGTGGQPTNNVMGQGKKNVTLIEYGDYQCPVCNQYTGVLKQVTAKYAEDIYFQFRNLPLVSIHQNAFAAARAAEASGMQNKYWQMYDKLYENQNQWSSSSNPVSFFKLYAKDIGLNASKFDTDYASGKVNDSINADVAAFKKTGQEQATPTFFLNSKYISNNSLSDPQTGSPSLEKFSALIDQEIAKKN